jgi:hypothetical protein
VILCSVADRMIRPISSVWSVSSTTSSVCWPWSWILWVDIFPAGHHPLAQLWALTSYAICPQILHEVMMGQPSNYKCDTFSMVR